MPLHVSYNGLLSTVFSYLDLKDAGKKRLVFRCMDQLALLHRQGHGIAVTPVNYCGNFSFATQAAARTFPHVFTEFRDNCCSISHDKPLE
jgi:hypothetical protein